MWLQELAGGQALHPGPGIFRIFDDLFGEPSISLDFKWFRGIRGAQTSTSGAGLHMDNVYMGRGSARLQ